MTERLKVNGVGRDPENARVINVFFSREPTDDEMRAFHDAVRAAPPIEPEQPAP